MDIEGRISEVYHLLLSIQVASYNCNMQCGYENVRSSIVII